MIVTADTKLALATQLAKDLGGDPALWSALVEITHQEHEAEAPALEDLEAMLRTWWSEDTSPSSSREAPETPPSPLAEYSGLEAADGDAVRRAVVLALRDEWKVSRLAAALLRRDVAGPRPPSSAELEAAFDSAFDAAYDDLKDPGGLDLVLLLDLRHELAAYDRAAFDAALERLRRANRYVLHTHDGRHGRLTELQIAAGIREGRPPHDRLFVYAARRNRE